MAQGIGLSCPVYLKPSKSLRPLGLRDDFYSEGMFKSPVNVSLSSSGRGTRLGWGSPLRVSPAV